MQLRKIRVLLIDDDEDDYLLTRDLLSEIRSQKYELAWASNFEKGLAALRNADHDVCLLDYTLGFRTGLELIGQAEAIKAPVILLTGMDNPTIDEEAMRLGAADYLVKGTINATILDRSMRYAINQFRAREELRQMHEISEQLVRERTAELAQTVEELIESRNFLASLTRNLPNVSLIVVNRQLKNIHADGNLLKQINISPEDIIGKNLKALLTPKQFALAQEPLESAFQGAHKAIEFHYSGYDLLVNFVPLPDAQQNITRVMIVAQNVTEMRRAEAEMRQALHKERQLNELKSRFVSLASHEFRTPLATILSSTSLIGKYKATGDEEKVRKHISRIKTSVSNLTGTLDDFLSLDKLEEGAIRYNPETFNLVELCEEVQEEIQINAKLGQSVEYAHFGIGAEVTLDKLVLRNVLLNLLSNGIKYSPENASVRLETILKKHTLAIRVSDQGIGIPEEDQKYLFNLFFRASNSTNIQGTGLGLNIVKKYLELMGGDIAFSSEMNKGTTFTVTIPINHTAHDKSIAHRG